MTPNLWIVDSNFSSYHYRFHFPLPPQPAPSIIYILWNIICASRPRNIFLVFNLVNQCQPSYFRFLKPPNNASLWCDVVVIWISAKSQYYSRANMRIMRFKSYFNQIQIFYYFQSQKVQDRSKVTLICTYVLIKF